MGGQRLMPNSEEEGHGASSQRPSCRRSAQIAAVAVFGLAGLCFAGLSRGGRPEVVEGPVAEKVTGLTESRFCSQYPYLKFELPHAVVYNNLANKGPNHGNGEGIVYKTIDLGQGAGNEYDREVYLTVNATGGDYHPFSPRLNGMQGKYGSINLDSGSHVNLEFNFFDRLSMKQLEIPELAFTFFDLDTGNGGKSREYVTIGGFKSYHLTDDTEVRVSDAPGGQKKFAASTVGTGEDNPLDPMFLTPQQKNRAVTLLFDKVKTVKATIGAEPGSGPRFFTFVGRPSLLCAVTVQEGFKPPLPDLVVEPPMQVGVVGGEDDIFVRFVAHPGQEVKSGDVVAVVRSPSGAERNLVAPRSGRVRAIQDKLKPNEKLRERLDEKTLAIIEMTYLEPLPVGGDVLSGGPGKSGKDGGVPAHSTFVKYLVQVGDPVVEGDPIAVVKDVTGKEVQLHATSWGTVKALEEGLEPGDSIERSKDMNLISLEPLKPLGPLTKRNVVAAVVEPGMEFVEYKVKKGDIIKFGDPVAVIKDGQGKRIIKTATHGGIISGLQDLTPGTPIDRVSDRNLVTTGKFPPLPLNGDKQSAVPFTSVSSQAPAADTGGAGAGAAGGAGAGAASEGSAGAAVATWPSEGLKFVKYHVKVGDVVEDGTPIATVRDKDGKEGDLLSPQPGVVEEIQEGLQEGHLLGKVMEDENIATIGPLPSLEVDKTESGSFGPNHGNWEFDGWTVDVGDQVDSGDEVAVLKDKDSGATREVEAGKSGTVTQRQEHLQKGDIVERVTEDEDLVTVGLFQEPEIHFREIGVQAPDMDLIFKDWLVEKGDRVHFGDPIAELEVPYRRLVESDGSVRRLHDIVQIPSPGTGWISYLADLKAGQSIRNQSVGPGIAKLDVGMPWWLVLLGALIGLCCCLGCLFKIMEKQKPLYKPMPLPPVETQPEPPPEPEPFIPPPAPKPPPPEPEPKPDGLRLDFDDAGRINTVYAKWRPLGIKHKYVAPIVAHNFTINSYAKQKLGVKDGWKLTRINDTELNDNPHFDQVNEMLSNYMKDFPLYPLPLEFRRQLSDDNCIVVNFVERPIGIEFSNVAPIHVGKVHPDSPAARNGIEVGWYLTKIGEYDVHENHDFRDVMKHFREGVDALDEVGKKPPPR